MTSEQIAHIQVLRRDGYGYLRIANVTGIPVGTIRTYFRRHKEEEPNVCVARNGEQVCKFCGGPVIKTSKSMKRIFCSDECRITWWRLHPDQLNRKAYYDYVCPHCNKPFRAYGNSKRKYCSLLCYMKARFGEDKG